MILELNIGLNVKGSANRLKEINERAAVAIDFVENKLSPNFRRKPLFQRYDSEYEDPSGQLVLEHGLFVKFYRPGGLSGTGDIGRLIFELSCLLCQDCIAVYVPRSNGGKLIGPDADAWGAFNPEFFRRFDGALRAAA